MGHFLTLISLNKIKDLQITNFIKYLLRCGHANLTAKSLIIRKTLQAMSNPHSQSPHQHNLRWTCLEAIQTTQHGIRTTNMSCIRKGTLIQVHNHQYKISIPLHKESTMITSNRVHPWSKFSLPLFPSLKIYFKEAISNSTRAVFFNPSQTNVLLQSIKPANEKVVVSTPTLFIAPPTPPA